MISKSYHFIKKLSSTSNKKSPPARILRTKRGQALWVRRADRVSGVCLRFSPNQYHGNIIDVGTGSACDNKPLHRLQGVVGIVVLQGVEHVPTRCCLCCGGVALLAAAAGYGLRRFPPEKPGMGSLI